MATVPTPISARWPSISPLRTMSGRRPRRSKIAEAFRTIARTPEFQSALADPAVRDNPANDVVLQIIQAGGGPDAGKPARGSAA